MKQKKGISPLIATILLIGFTVILAVIVFTWGQGWFGGLTGGQAEQTNLQLACVNKGGLSIKEICAVDATNTRVTVINTGALAHTSCTLAGGGTSISCNSLPSGGVGVYTLTSGLSAGDVISSVFKITTDLGDSTCQGSSYKVSSAGLSPCS